MVKRNKGNRLFLQTTMYSKEIIQLLLENKDISSFGLTLYKYKPGKMDEKRKLYWASRGGIFKKLDLIDKAKKEDWAFGINSLVKNKKGQFLHIPQVDLHCKISKNNLRYITKELKSIGYGKGFVAVTGRSYHFYGNKLLDQGEWVAFMGYLLRFNDHRRKPLKKVTDQRWIGASLVRGFGTLRISSSFDKRTVPRVVLRLK